jgi:hypothetical protein
MTTLTVSIMQLIMTLPGTFVPYTSEVKFDFNSYSECLQSKQTIEPQLVEANNKNILGYSLTCK